MILRLLRRACCFERFGNICVSLCFSDGKRRRVTARQSLMYIGSLYHQETRECDMSPGSRFHKWRPAPNIRCMDIRACCHEKTSNFDIASDSRIDHGQVPGWSA